MDENFRNGRHVVYNLTAHLVLTPKYRRKVFTPEVADLTQKYLQEVCKKHEVILEEFNTDQDHAHLLISYPPKVNLSRFVGSIKGYSSRMLRKDHFDLIKDKLYGDHFWSPSYLILSTGGARTETVKKYIQNQGNKPRKAGNPNFRKRD